MTPPNATSAVSELLSLSFGRGRRSARTKGAGIDVVVVVDFVKAE